MSRVIPLDDPEALRLAMREVLDGVEAGRIKAVAVATVEASGGLGAWWAASRTLGAHAGSILRGAVAYLAAVMDAEALEG